ncbi:hypothetical protein FOQG_19093 [Fusarium oxysporum f. sp. raphani 54005]|nr:hypothetical protein FOQG_19093 [Fusarium oxysporum f. sp. raphani 54005]EXL65613.1 hypothetical protein FOPG_18166 [Fusarium oxysporum f. sp. conglutinans race 2 54008]KAF6515434.1 hypothetical protein HZS61_005340 [Fusarium oxysporum f. sp. conglutinans]KAI8401786.1 hypothetical protein FOFC_18655 [Fusarium oxysporum]
MLRNNFRTSTWILAGACAQSLLVCLAPHAWSLAPAAVLLGWRLADTLLMVLGVSKNRYLDDNIPGKWTVHFPDSTTGEFSERPADADVCVIIVAARSNHPLGMFAPNYKTLFEFVNKNVADLEANAPENGYLGMSGWLGAGDRPTGSEAMVVGYFKDDWWNSIVKDNPHLGIMHEVYMVPKKHWESIYINYHRTGLAATNAAIPASVEKPGQTKTQEDTIWVAPIVDSRNGVWKSSKGRMGREESDKIRRE